MRGEDVVIDGLCEKDWERMRREHGGLRRWCGHCERQVHDISAMSEPAARAFLQATRGRDVCIAYFEDDRGEIEFAPRVAEVIVPIARVRRRPAPLVEAAKLASAASIAALLGACTPHGDDGQTIQVDNPVVTPTAAHGTVIPTVGAAPPDPTVGSVEPKVHEPRRLPKKGKRKIGLLDHENPLGEL
jgi:hypothetical protein